MSVINRIILFFYALAFGAVSLLVMGLFTRFFPDSQVWNEFLYLCGRWETMAAAVVVFILSLYLILQSLSTHSNNVVVNEAVIVMGKMGEVRISLAALKSMADRIAHSVSGVHDVKVRLKMAKTSAKDKTLIPNFYLRLVVGEEKNIISISDDIKSRITSYLNDFIGIEKVNVDINVVTISDSVDKSKKRVI